MSTRSWTTLFSGSLIAAGLACTSGGLSISAAETPQAGSAKSEHKLSYPQTKKIDHVDNHHGTPVPDPYRWLEDPDSAETKAWVEAQNKVTFGYLDQIPARAKIKERLTKLWNYERYGVPFREGDRYFISKNNGLQNQNVLFTMSSLESEPKLLLDPNKLSSDGTVALSSYEVTDDGKLMAYGLSSAGSDWQEWKVRDVETSMDLPDHIRWVKFSGASWSRDGKGFFYSRYDEPNEATKLQALNYYQKLYYHRVGTPQSSDILVYDRKDRKEWGFGGDVTEDGRYLIIHVRQGTDTKNRVFYKDLNSPDSPVIELLNAFDASYDFVANDGPIFWFHTDLNAPRGKLIAIDISKPEREHWKVVIPEAMETLRGVSLINDLFLASYMQDARSRVKVFRRDGSFLRDVDLPGLGTAVGFSGKRTDKETFYSFTSFTVPATIYRYEVETGRSTIFRQPKVDFKSDAYETRQVFYPSKDGTRVPMFITHKKGVKLDGQNPTYLYGYGGFNISLTPTFSPANAVWLEMGGIYAQPSLRGGGEYGEDWHQAGMKLKKQNVFDDFIAAAACRGMHDPATGAVWRNSSGGGRDGYAALSQVHDRMGLGLRLRLGRQC
jgi:prolyl oligopeptidase